MCPTLALLGIGNGAQVALAYAGSHPNKVARLVLDSPLPLGISAEAATEQRVKGEQTALDAWATQCQATNCPLGPDPKAAVDALLAQARNGSGPGGASVAAIADAISTALGYPRGGRVDAGNELAIAIADARSGDTNRLNNLINQAETLRQTDGQFVNTCSDALNRPTPDRVRELVVAWGRMYPQFGTVGALDMVKCLNWPSGSAPKEPERSEDPDAAARCAEQPDRRQRGCGGRCRDGDQRRLVEPAGDVAGRRARRDHLHVLRAAPGDRVPEVRRAAVDRHLLPGLTDRSYGWVYGASRA